MCRNVLDGYGSASGTQIIWLHKNPDFRFSTGVKNHINAYNSYANLVKNLKL